MLTPLALLALALKRSVAPTWCSVPVIAREIAEHEATDDPNQARSLGIFVLPESGTVRIAACALKS